MDVCVCYADISISKPQLRAGRRCGASQPRLVSRPRSSSPRARLVLLWGGDGEASSRSSSRSRSRQRWGGRGKRRRACESGPATTRCKHNTSRLSVGIMCTTSRQTDALLGGNWSETGPLPPTIQHLDAPCGRDVGLALYCSSAHLASAAAEGAVIVLSHAARGGAVRCVV